MMEWLTELPDAAIGAVLGASIAIFGVIINGVVTHWNTGRQLNHDREQKAAERSMSLRREIYLGVAEHLYNGLLMVGALTDLSLDNAEIVRPWRESTHFNAKIHVVGGPELVTAVVQANRAITEAVVALRPMRSQIDELSGRRAALTAVISDAQASSARALSYLRERQLAGPVSSDEVQRILDLGKSSNALAEKMMSDQAAITVQLQAFHVALTRRMMIEHGRIYQVLVPVIAAARKELQLAFDPSPYAKMKEENAEASALIEKLLTQVYPAEATRPTSDQA